MIDSVMHHSARSMWAAVEQASKRAVTAGGVASEVQAAVGALPAEAIDAATNANSVLPLLKEAVSVSCCRLLSLLIPEFSNRNQYVMSRSSRSFKYCY